MKKVVFAILSLGLAFVACKKSLPPIINPPKVNNTVLHFDYSIYDNRHIIYSVLDDLSLNSIDTVQVDTVNYLPLQNNIEYINNSLQTSLSINNFDRFQVENQEKDLDDYFNDGYLSHNEYNVLYEFLSKKVSLTFDDALDSTKSYILSLDLSVNEFKKFNDLINILMIIDEYYSNQGVDIFLTTYAKPKISVGCALAIAGNATSTLGLNTCLFPGPNCALAVVAKAISLAGIYYSC